MAVGLLAAVALVGLISMGSSPAELLAKPTHQAHKARVMHAAHKVISHFSRVGTLLGGFSPCLPSPRAATK